MKNLFTALIIALFATPAMLSADAASLQAARQLVEICPSEKVMNEIVNVTFEIQKQENPELAANEAPFREFFTKYMKDVMNDMVEVYAEVFTETELLEIIAFYKTATGQKSLEKLPEIMQLSMQKAQTALMQNIGELEALLSPDLITN